jgi:hypothetical protein
MGYYIRILQEGKMYELDGKKLQFIEKYGQFYYFNVCKYDEYTLKYEPTNERLPFTRKEIEYIKRLQDEPMKVGLRKIGRDKVFQRY